MNVPENKVNRLQAALGAAMGVQDDAPAPVAAPAPAEPLKLKVKKGRAARPSRDGRKLVAAHLDPKIVKKLKNIGTDDDMTMQQMLEEAIDLFLAKKGYRKP